MKARAYEINGVVEHLITTTAETIEARVIPRDDAGNPVPGVVEHEFDFDASEPIEARDLWPHLEVAAGRVRVKASAPAALRALELRGGPNNSRRV